MRRRRRSVAGFDTLRRGQAPLHPRRRGRRARSIIDDYAHHPVEIRAVLSAAREARRRRRASSPSSSRTATPGCETLMDDFQNAFNDADIVFVAPVYAAGEEPIEGVDSAALVEGLRAHGHRMVKTVDRPDGPRRSPARHRRRGRHDRLHGRRRHHQMGGGPGRRHRARRRKVRRRERRRRRLRRPTVRGKAEAGRAARAARLVQERRRRPNGCSSRPTSTT